MGFVCFRKCFLWPLLMWNMIQILKKIYWEGGSLFLETENVLVVLGFSSIIFCSSVLFSISESHSQSWNVLSSNGLRAASWLQYQHVKRLKSQIPNENTVQASHMEQTLSSVPKYLFHRKMVRTLKEKQNQTPQNPVERFLKCPFCCCCCCCFWASGF